MNPTDTPAFKAAMREIKKLHKKYPPRKDNLMHNQNVYRYRMKRWDTPIRIEPKKFIEDIMPERIYSDF